MKTLFFDCGMGAAGDMLTAALLEIVDNPEDIVGLINRAGIPACTITGTAVHEGEHITHAWNFAELDGAVYAFDPTWDNTDRFDAAGREYLQHLWFGVTTAELNMTHTPEKEFDDIAALSNADNYYIRENAVITDDSLSQGQKQLLCITRVMLCLPPMLILDEATSSIDTRTEVLIQQAFDKLMQGRTSFIVAHRLSTIRGADRILVMKDGHVIEQGNHASLMAQNGFYASLYNAQFAPSDI